jgi:uncharacterized protein YjbI with pentapeptide repeats
VAHARAAKKTAVTAPRLSPVALEDLEERPAPDFVRGGKYDGGRYSRAAADGLELSGADFAECEFQGVSFNDTQLRGTGFRDCIVGELYAPVFRAARSTWRDVEFRNPRLGSASGTRVALKNCTIGTLDLTGARLKDFDLRGTEFRSISGLGSLAGVVIDDYQLSLLAPLLAAHLGVTVL